MGLGSPQPGKCIVAASTSSHASFYDPYTCDLVAVSNSLHHEKDQDFKPGREPPLQWYSAFNPLNANYLLVEACLRERPWLPCRKDVLVFLFQHQSRGNREASGQPFRAKRQQRLHGNGNFGNCCSKQGYGFVYSENRNCAPKPVVEEKMLSKHALLWVFDHHWN